MVGVGSSTRSFSALYKAEKSNSCCPQNITSLSRSPGMTTWEQVRGGGGWRERI